MARSTARSKPTLQIVLQGEARQLQHRLDLSNIAYEVLDQPGPMALRVAVADWGPIRAIATEHGYDRPDFFCQTDSVGKDPFSAYWCNQRPVRTP